MKVNLKLTNHGFTLVELLISLVISGIIMTGVYSAFKSQQDSYLAQEQVAEMQQSIRAGLDFMVREIRTAGYRGNANSDADFIAAQADALAFSADLDEDGVTGSDENFAFDRYGMTLGRISNNTSAIVLTETPSGSGHFEASAASNHQPLAENIENLEFNYTLDDGSQTITPADPSDIRSIQISILARAKNPDRNYTNTQTYTSASGADWTPATPDNFRRRFETMTVKCRNMGLGL